MYPCRCKLETLGFVFQYSVVRPLPPSLNGVRVNGRGRFQNGVGRRVTEAYSEPSRTSKMVFFAKIVNG